MNLELLQRIDRIHPYPAKFTIDLALKYILKYTKEKDVIYDPFMGAGTTLLASSMTNRYAFGTDINYIGVLIAKFKLLKLSSNEILNLTKFINEFEKNYNNKIKEIELFFYPSINHWFCDEAIMVLSLIKNMINTLADEKEKIFCKLVTSSIINVISNQDSDTRYAAIKKPNLTIENIANIFIKKFKTTLKLFIEFNKENRLDLLNQAMLLNSANCKNILEKNSVDLILTSPPYINTYDYYLYHKHRMYWLDYDVKYSMENEIGSRREYSSLKKDSSKFNSDLFKIFSNCNNILKNNAHIIIIIGDGRVCGKTYDAKENIIQALHPLNWTLVDYSYSFLDQTSRSFQQSYRTKGKKEHILIFQKRA